MPSLARLLPLAPLLAAVAAPTPAAAQGAVAGTQASTPTLVVFITVDQLRADYLPRFYPQLTGGLKRLWDGGAVFTDAHQDHGITETAPGHATTMSGRVPASTGITENELGVGDPESPLVGSAAPGASPRRFRGTVLADWLRARDARTRVLSVSRKDRAAILPVGRSAAQQVLWYAPDDGGKFTTSRWYGDTIPAWVQRFNARRFVRPYAGKAWTPLLPESAYPERDSVMYESMGVLYAFPHVLPADPQQAAEAFAGWPWMDEVTAALALEGLEALGLGRGPQTDLLAVSFSTTDAVGHRFGPDSRELHDQVLRVDRAIGAFIDSLYRLRDSSRVVLALTSDHGVAPFPEVRFPGDDYRRGRVDAWPVLIDHARRLAARGVPPRALAFGGGILSVDRDAFARARVDVDGALRDVARDLARLPGVLRADLRSDLPRKAARGDSIARRWLNSLPDELPAALVVTAQPYHIWTDFDNWPGASQATHGSPHDYDTHVPLIFYGPPFRAGKHAGRARVVDAAPTLARVLGVTPAERLDGVVLEAALR